MAFDVQQFRASLLYDGARPSLFEVSMTVPAPIAIGNVNQQITFRARAASLPGDSISQITLNYFGREIKVAGTRTFPEYTITVINDEDFVIRNTFENWMSAINSHVSNVRRPGFVQADGGYQADVFVSQFGKTGGAGGAGAVGLGAVIKDYGLIGAFPTDISPIELDWGTGDAVEEFTITFAYQWWETYAPRPTTDTGSGNVRVPGR